MKSIPPYVKNDLKTWLKEDLLSWFIFLHPMIFAGILLYMMMLMYQMIPKTNFFMLRRHGFTYLGENQYKMILNDQTNLELQLLGRNGLDFIILNDHGEIFKYRFHGIGILDGIAYVLKTKCDFQELNSKLRDLIITNRTDFTSSKEFRIDDHAYYIEVSV